MTIEILGTGCPNCRRLEQRTRDALDRTGIPARLEKVEEMAEIMRYGVLGLPGLVIDGEVAVAGRVPEVDEIVGLLRARSPATG